MLRRPARFAFRLYVVQILLITAVAAVFTGLAIFDQQEIVRRDNESNIRALALTGASLPGVVEGLESGEPAEIQPLVEALQDASGVDYVTVVGMDGIRVAHTNPALIGLPVSSDHSAVRAGEGFVGVEDGPSGRTFRVKEPVRDGDGNVVGTLSIGIADDRLTGDVVDRSLELVVVAGAAVLLGSVLSWVVTVVLRRWFHGIDPDQIPTLLQTRESVLEGIGDGLVLVDADGDVVLANGAAQQLLGVPDAVGRPAAQVLPGSVRSLLAGDAASSPRHRSANLTVQGRHLEVTAWRSTLAGKDTGATVLLQDRTELMGALDELQSQRSLVTHMRRETHEFDNRMHVVGGLLALGRHQDAAALLAADSAPDARPDDERMPDDRPGDQRPDEAGAPDTSAIRDAALAGMVHSLTREAADRGIDLELTEDSAVDHPVVPVDAVLTTILGNLVTNAIEAARARVRIYLRMSEEGFDCLVEDDGPGVDPRVAGRIFDEGVSTKGTGQPGEPRRGTGLYLVRTLVASRGGDVEVVDSSLGGAAFAVWLPRVSRARAGRAAGLEEGVDGAT